MATKRRAIARPLHHTCMHAAPWPAMADTLNAVTYVNTPSSTTTPSIQPAGPQL